MSLDTCAGRSRPACSLAALASNQVWPSRPDPDPELSWKPGAVQPLDPGSKPETGSIVSGAWCSQRRWPARPPLKEHVFGSLAMCVVTAHLHLAPFGTLWQRNAGGATGWSWRASVQGCSVLPSSRSRKLLQSGSLAVSRFLARLIARLRCLRNGANCRQLP